MDEQARRDLEIVRRLMEDARGVEWRHGPHFVLWGALSAVALLLTWGSALGAIGLAPVWIWAIVLTLGWLGSFRLSMRAGGASRRVTAGSRLLGGIWVGAGVTLTTIGMLGVAAGAVPVILLPGLLSLVFGAAYWATAAVTARRGERGYAIGWWVGGAAMLLWPNGLWTLPTLAGMVVGLEVVPGLILVRRGRRAEARALEPGLEAR